MRRSALRGAACAAALVLTVASSASSAGAAGWNTTCSGAAFFVPDVTFADAKNLPKGLPTDRVVKLFAQAGIALTWDPPESPLMIVDYAMDYGGQGAQLDKNLLGGGIRSLIKQANGNPVSYTFTFNRTIANFSFRRAPLHAGSSGVTNPPWTAIAHAANGSTVAQVSEAEIASYSDVAGKTFVLSGPARIKSITFSGDDHKVDGQSNVVMDALGWCP